MCFCRHTCSFWLNGVREGGGEGVGGAGVGGGWVAVLAVERDLYFSLCVTPDTPPAPSPSVPRLKKNIGLGIFHFYSLI